MTFSKPIFALLCLLFVLLQLKAESAVEFEKVKVASDTTKVNYLIANKVSITDSIVNFGKLFLNTPYRYGSSGTSSFDCSGFTSYVYSNFGYNLQRSSSDQATQFEAINRDKLKAGDLVFFSGRRKSKHVGHVGIVVDTKGNGVFDFIHASVQSGVVISCSDESYYDHRFIKANRVIYENKMLAVANTSTQNNNSVALSSTQNTKTTKQTTKIIPAEYHKVKSGETLSSISSKFGVSIAELKKRNNLKGSKINPNQRLKIIDERSILVEEEVYLASTAPASIDKVKSDLAIAENISATSTQVPTTVATHTVKKGETLFSISNMYKVSVDELKRINKIAGNAIHFGDVLKVNQFAEAFAKKEVVRPVLTHKVGAGETLFSISKKYNIPVDELKAYNKLTSNSIQSGQTIKIAVAQESQLGNNANANVITHKVGPGESYSTISQIYGCTIEKIKEWNKKTGNKLNVGEKLTIYSKVV